MFTPTQPLEVTLGVGASCISALAALAWSWHTHRKLRREHAKEHRINQHMTALLWATNTGTWSWDLAAGELVVNDRWLQILGLPFREYAHSTMSDWQERIHPEDRQRSADAMRRCLQRVTDHYRCELRMRHSDGHWVWVDIRGRVVHWTQNQRAIRMMGTQIDVSDRKAAEQREHHRSKILQMLATDTALEAILESLARAISETDPRMLCAIRLHDPHGRIPTASIAPHLPGFFIRTIDGFESLNQSLDCESGSDAIIAADLATHPSWIPYSTMAAQAGLGACWSQPIIASTGERLGTLSVFLRQPAAPTQAQLQMLEDEARLTALAIERSTASNQQQLAASVFSHAKEGISITDANGMIVEVNETFCAITGYSREEAIGRNHRFLQSGRQSAEFYAAMWQEISAKGSWCGELWNRRKNGEIYAQLSTISAVRSAHGEPQHYVALFTDITALKTYQNQLEHIAHYDALTHLPNRVLLADRLQQAIAQSQRHASTLAVAYLDLDGFKAVNDQHGHNVGDELLVAVSRRMKAALRDCDTLARIGGDEFVAVLTDIGSAQGCDTVLRRLLSAANEVVGVAGLRLQVSASIGVTLYPADTSDADMLMRHADQAMYAAKQAGKNCIHVFDVAQDVQVQNQNEKLQQLRVALQQRQFVLYFQPKVNLRTGAIIGAEALVRWNHPVQGVLAPAAFLPALDNQPLAMELDQWVLENALEQCSQWRRQGLNIPISVNVGANQVQQEGFLDNLRSTLVRFADIQASDLELEILETSALQDLTGVAHILHACKDLGVGFAIDDFGTGYSSLTYLKHLPVSTLKIDQSFIRDMITQPADHALVEGVIAMSSAFKCRVIAEGVETAAHGDLLMRLGCDLAQGYGIARPMPADDVLSWAARWNSEQGRGYARARASKPHLVAVGGA